MLRSFGLRPVPGARITLIARDIETPYSGMLPGFIAGHYTREQCYIDLRPLARFAGARLIHDEAIGLDLRQRRVSCRTQASIGYDLLSIDIGSTPHLSSTPGADQYATPVKPIEGSRRGGWGSSTGYGKAWVRRVSLPLVAARPEWS